jgi:porphobilinogen deaminase
MQPHPQQGALAIVVRREDGELFRLLNVLNNKKELSEV